MRVRVGLIGMETDTALTRMYNQSPNSIGPDGKPRGLLCKSTRLDHCSFVDLLTGLSFVRQKSHRLSVQNLQSRRNQRLVQGYDCPLDAYRSSHRKLHQPISIHRD